ncbi:MAG: MipA/OmpV family protein [Sphingomonadaceae bacterium]|nr:MipA/OmpV family protein [Sphingomonadaceae bacterium]
MPTYPKAYDFLIATVSLFTLSFSLPALAGQPEDEAVQTVFEAEMADDDPNQLMIGLGVGIGPTYDGSDNYRLIPGGIVQGRLSGFDFAFRGPSLAIDLIRDGRDGGVNIIAGPVIQGRFERTGGIEDDRVALLGEKDAALELGGEIGFAIPGAFGAPGILRMTLTGVHDVTDVHDSFLLSPRIGYMTPVASGTLAMLGVLTTYVGEGYGKTYFDVPAIVLPDPTLSAYTLQDGGFKDVGANLMLIRQLGDEPGKVWSLFALGGYTRLLGKYADSPIVADAGDRDSAFGVVGIAFRF